MSGSVLGKSPRRLDCVRMLTVGGSSASRLLPTSKPSLTPLIQTRGRTYGRPTDRGVLVRLLEDIPKFGRKDAIFRTERGRMRNYWYPKKQAEYLTLERFGALGLTKADIGERNATFAPFVAAKADASAVVADAGADEPAPMVVNHPSPEEALNFVDDMVPNTLTFFAKLTHARPASKPAVEQPKQMSPLVAEPAPAPAAPNEELSEAVSRAMLGSVSTTDIANELRRFLADNLEASTVALGPENIRFVTLEAGTDRVNKIGRYEIDIFMPHGAAQPVRRIIEVLSEVEASTDRR